MYIYIYFIYIYIYSIYYIYNIYMYIYIYMCVCVCVCVCVFVYLYVCNCIPICKYCIALCVTFSFSRDRSDRPDPADFTIADLEGATSGRLPGTIKGQQFMIKNCKVCWPCFMIKIKKLL